METLRLHNSTTRARERAVKEKGTSASFAAAVIQNILYSQRSSSPMPEVELLCPLGERVVTLDIVLRRRRDRGWMDVLLGRAGAHK